MLELTDYLVSLALDLLAGGPGSGRHASGIVNRLIPDMPKEIAQWHKDEVNAWLDKPAGLKILSVKHELLDPNTLKSTQSWYSRGKIAEWKDEGKTPDKMDPVTVVRTKDGDWVFDGTHRTEFAKQEGTKIPALVHTVAFKQDVAAGGPGSGWTTENGHIAHAKVNAEDLSTHLQSLAKTPLPGFVKTATKQLAAVGLDTRYFDSRFLTKFRTADKLSIHPLAIANYNESKRLLEFRNDADAGSVTHELAHHLDLTFVRQPDKQAGDKFTINKDVAAKIVNAYTSEWKAAKDNLSEALGHRFNFTNDNAKMEKQPGLVKNLPTLYAADGPKEWFAESFYLYCKGVRSAERLERVAPKTFAAVKAVINGRIFN